LTPEDGLRAGEPDDRPLSLAEVRSRHPPLLDAVLADARITAAHRGERFRFGSRLDGFLQALRLMWVSDAFLAQALYRVKARLQAWRVPVLPRVAHRAAVVLGQVSIGDPVVMRPGVYLLHGQVVIDGFAEIRSGTVIAPFVTIGRRSPDLIAPIVGPRAHIGSGAKILGPIRVGADAKVGAGAVVLANVPAGRTAVGVPARLVATDAAVEASLD